MKFEYVWMLNLLLMIPVIVFLFVIENRKKKKALHMFAQPHLLPFLTEIRKKSTIFLKGFFLTLSMALLIVALSGPKWGSHYQDVQRKGIDVIFLLDVSKSMLAEDVKPGRLERAKREISDFLKVAEGDRVGLVVFSGDAFVQCPLTLDYEAISMFIDSIDTDTVPIMGTNMGKGINVSLDAFDYTHATDKVIVMITDGEDNEQKGFDQAVKAKDKGVKIFVYGIGNNEGAPIPDQNGGFKKDNKGNLILSRLNESNLIKIANITEGEYVLSVTGDLDLDRLYFDGIRKKTQARELQSDKIKIHEERFPLFIALALFCLMIEACIDLKFKRKRSVSGVIILCLMLLPDLYVFAAESGEHLYRNGLYKEAEEAFLEEDMENPKDVRSRYNRGCASFKNSNFKGAASAFKSVLRRTDKKNIKFNASFNLGNTLYMNGKYGEAASYFKDAVKLNPEDEDARYNYELVQKTVKASENKQKDSDENDSGEQQKKDGNKEKTQKTKDGNQHEEHNQKSEHDPNKTDESTEAADGGDLKTDSSLNDSGKDRTNSTQSDMNNKNMTYNEAQAFIDNVTEDPSDMNKLRFKGRDVYPQSKKDW